MAGAPGLCKTMRALTIIATIAAAAALLVAVTGAGADPEAPRPAQAVDGGPRHQLLGAWRLRERASFEFERRSGGVVDGRARRDVRIGRCTLEDGTAVFRGFHFVRRRGDADVWAGQVARPTRACRLRYVRSRIMVLNDLRLVETSRRDGRERTRRLRRMRPPATADDPVLGVWERNGGGVIVHRRGRVYVGVSREAFLIANGCTVSAGTAVWRLRPSAPGRYDGATSTFMPPPDCGKGRPSRSEWRLAAGGRRLVREAPDGSEVEYRRAG